MRAACGHACALSARRKSERLSQCHQNHTTYSSSYHALLATCHAHLGPADGASGPTTTDAFGSRSCLVMA